jgi:dGTP triphosphohydrolase
MPEEYINIANEDGIERAVCDYIAGMSDTYALKIRK